MVSDRARALALRLLASYPGWPVSEMSVLAIAEALDAIGSEMERVTDEARHEFTKPPSVAQLDDVARRVRADEEPPKLLLPVREILEEMPAEIREKVRGLTEKWSLEAELRREDPASIERRRVLAARVAAARAVGQGMPPFAEVSPEDPCDRCDHEARWHKADWHCVHEMGRKDDKPARCLCDGFFPKPSEQSA